MDSGKRQHLQDIYSSDRTSRDDFTPQVSSEIAAERKRDMRRHAITSFSMGFAILALAIALVYVVVREYIDILSEGDAPAQITTEYIPRYSLASEEQWVLDFDREMLDPNLDWNKGEERPFSAFWVKKAAANIIMAQQAYGVGEFTEAAEYFENALEILPELEGVKVPLGMTYFQLKKFDKALTLLDGASDADLTYDILNNLGAACISAEAYDRGEKYLKRSLELKPAYAEALRNLALLQEKSGDQANAIKNYETYLDQRPTDTDTRHNFALYLTKLGEWKIAGEQLRYLTREIKDDATLFKLLARVEMKLGNDKAAIAAFQRAMELSDPQLALGWMSEKEFDRLREDKDFQAIIKSVE